MVFAIDPETKRLVARVPQGDGFKDYGCVADTCRNPACRCLTVTVTFRASSSDGPVEPAPTPERAVGLDLDTRTIDGTFSKSASPSDLAFAEGLLAAMEPADFDLLRRIHLMIKSRETELAKPAEIKVQFDFDEIERSSIMQAYNDVLPFAETMHVVVNGIEYVVLDQYCVKPGCRCTDALLNLLPITEKSGTADTTGVVIVDYQSKAWKPLENDRLPCNVATIAHLIEGTNPDLYGKLPARHKKLRAIYAHCRKREQASLPDNHPVRAVGRNDPCPCGSGKKFKKCCLGKGVPNAPASGAEASINIRR
jgi:hypothetical protein